MIFKKQSIASNLQFSNFPETIQFEEPKTINIQVNGFGLVVGSTGLRWWDSNDLPASGTITRNTGDSIIFPFKKSTLKQGVLLDLIATVTLQGIKYIYGASNSPDNVVVSTPAVGTNLYYITLFCSGLNNNFGNSNTNNNFMQGGNSIQAKSKVLAYIFLSDLTQTSGVFNITAQYIAYDGGAPDFVFSKQVSYSSNTLTIPLVNINEFVNAYQNSTGYLTYLYAGYYKIKVTNPDPSFTSLLNFYHWGQSNFIL